MTVSPSRILMKLASLSLLGGICLNVKAAEPAGKSSVPPAKVTFNEHIAPVIFNNCSSCHRPGEGTPFNLLDYHDVKKRGSLIQSVTDSRYMPPWPPAQGWGHFKDERRLTDDQVALIAKWVDTGMEEGPREKLPPLPKFPEGGWSLGEPDLIVKLPEAFDVPADGPDIYRAFALRLNLPEDKWVTAVDIRPSARSVVHHALYFTDSTGQAMELDKADPRPGFRGMGFPRTGSLGGWAVGATPRILPMGLAYPLSKESDLVVQIHFHPSGKAAREQTTFGLYFAKKKPEKRLLGTQAPLVFGLGTRLKTEGIKAGDPNFSINGTWEVPFDIELVNVGGHAHYLCKTMKAVATLPSGEQRKLFAIDDWDFNWQGRYNYAEPVRLPKGTRVKATLTYDNSSDNPRNPSDPPKHIAWGEGSTDEMGSVGFAFVAVNESDINNYRGPSIFVMGDGFSGGTRSTTGDASATSKDRPPTKGAALLGRALRKGAGGGGGGGGGADRLALLNPELLVAQVDRLDKNGDGKVDRDELPEQYHSLINRLDVNHDDAITKEEIRSGFRAMRLQFMGDEADTGGKAGDAEKPTASATSPTDSSAKAASNQGMSDLDGRVWKPLAPEGKTKAHVLFFVTDDCPVSNAFSPEMARLAQEYSGKGVQFFLVEVDPDTSSQQAMSHAREYKLDLPILLDRGHGLIKRTGVKTTPEAAVVTPNGEVVYSGRIDDRFVKLGRQRPEPSHRELKDALDAVLDGKPVAVKRAEAVGCPIADLVK